MASDNPDLVDLRLQKLTPRHPVFVCRECQTDLALASSLVTRVHGPWLLKEINAVVGLVFSRVENIEVDEGPQSVEVVGFGTKTIKCTKCKNSLGWTYRQVPNGSRLARGSIFLLRGKISVWDMNLERFDRTESPFFVCGPCNTEVAWLNNMCFEKHTWPWVKHRQRDIFVFKEVSNLRPLGETKRYGRYFMQSEMCKRCTTCLGFHVYETEEGAPEMTIARERFGLWRDQVLIMQPAVGPPMRNMLQSVPWSYNHLFQNSDQ